jgi:hypothetical protein
MGFVAKPALDFIRILRVYCDDRTTNLLRLIKHPVWQLPGVFPRRPFHPFETPEPVTAADFGGCFARPPEIKNKCISSW